MRTKHNLNIISIRRTNVNIDELGNPVHSNIIGNINHISENLIDVLQIKKSSDNIFSIIDESIFNEIKNDLQNFKTETVINNVKFKNETVKLTEPVVVIPILNTQNIVTNIIFILKGFKK